MWRYFGVLFGFGIVAAHAGSDPNQVLTKLPPASVIQPVQHQSAKERRETLCLALSIYYEARGESLDGQRAVGHVVLNRIRATGGSACAIIWTPGQFQWTRRPKLLPRDRASWLTAQWHAIELRYDPEDNTNGATMFYNARLSQPKWAKKGVVTARYGDHVFIRPRTLATIYPPRQTPAQSTGGRIAADP